ncbi:hypothetical protein SAMN05192541_12870 [Bradyrhizobium arachidis]|nr:hypothetical protein SAMN05192541_12870 [Bradyrhizobium arachidis]
MTELGSRASLGNVTGGVLEGKRYLDGRPSDQRALGWMRGAFERSDKSRGH